MPEELRVEALAADRLDEAVDVLCEAFFDYPVMRYVVGATGPEYARHLKSLIGFFTEARFLRRDLVLAVREGDGLLAVANLNRPGSLPPTDPARRSEDPVEGIRRRVWERVGSAARERYEAYGRATARFAYPEPHFHLGMIGVRRGEAGRGHGRRLLEHIHALSVAETASRGVSLTTEDPGNVSLYQRFGYGIVGQERVAEDLQTWGFFRPDDPRPPGFSRRAKVLR